MAKITRANVEAYATEKGLEPIQIDGIPEGFSWVEPDVEIGGIKHQGRLVTFDPLAEWEQGVHYGPRPEQPGRDNEKGSSEVPDH